MKKLLLLSFIIFSCAKDAPLPEEATITTFTLSVAASEGGSIDTPEGTYNENSAVTINAIPQAGYEFTGWSGDASGNANPLTFTITEDQNITATFSRTRYSLGVNVSGQGNVTREVISEAKTEEEYNSGTVVRLNATPESGWLFYTWSGSSTDTTNQIDVTVDGSKTVTASFEEQYTNVKDEANTFRGVGKWKIRKRGPETSKELLTDCDVLDIIFRTNGTFTIVTATSTVTGEYSVESNSAISLLLGSSSFGTITNLVLTDSYVGFTLELSTGCSGDNQGDRDEDYDETTDTITPREDRIIAEFEGNEVLNLFSFNGGSLNIDPNPDKSGINNSENSARIENIGELYEGVIVAPQISLDFNSLENQILKLDFYQETATEIILLAKLEQFVGAEDNEDLAQKDVEVEVSVNQSGWQTVTFDFRENRRNSFPFAEEPLEELGNFAFLSLFVGFGTSSPGTFYIDNIIGGVQGIEIPDTDGDTILDIIDNCIEEAGDITNFGCPLPPVYFEEGKCKCPNATVGDIAVFGDTTFTVVDNETIREEIANGNVNLCTSLVTEMTGRYIESENAWTSLFNDPTFNSDVSFWDTSNVINMTGMFGNATAFNQDISNWDTSNVTVMNHMFDSAISFNQNIGNWNVSNVLLMNYMFFNADSFNGNISDWDISSVQYIDNMFNGAIAFNQNIGSWDTSNVLGMSGVFDSAENFNQNIGGWDTSLVNNMESMFYDASVFNQDIGNWNTSSVISMKYMFDGASLFNQNIGSWDVSSVVRMDGMFGRTNSFNQDIGDWDTSNLNDMGYMFYNAQAFNQDISEWNTSNVTNMEHMFNGEPNATVPFNQDISNWDTSRVTSMRYMFANSSFNKNISNWDTSNVIDMQGFFWNTSFNQDISGWNISNVTNTQHMFLGALTFNQPISNWDTSSIVNMNGMFAGTEAFNQDIGNWNTSNVTNMEDMFNHAFAFDGNIGNWNTSSVTNMSYMFENAISFNQDIGNWNVTQVSNCASFSNNTNNWTLSKPNFTRCSP